MPLIGNLVFSIGSIKITTLNGTVNIGMTLIKNAPSSGDVIVFGDEKLPVDELNTLQREVHGDEHIDRGSED